MITILFVYTDTDLNDLHVTQVNNMTQNVTINNMTQNVNINP